MPEVKFGRKNEASRQFERSDDLIAVRTRSNRSLLSGPVLAAEAAELRDGQLVLEFPEAGVEVYRVPAGPLGRSVDDRKLALRTSPDVRFAGGVLVDEQSGEPVIYTENLFVKFIDDADLDECREVLTDRGLAIKEELAYATNAFFVAAPEGIGTAVFDIALQLLERDDVEYCHPEVVRKRNLRGIGAKQWHLKPATINGNLVNAHSNVEAAHALNQGAGVVIAIIDDGVDIDHPEFASAGKIVAPFNATTGSDDPRPVFVHPRNGDNHGTAVAGVACADGVAGASGVAPKAKLMPIRLASGLGSQSEANAFRWAADHGADIISCSWGPADGLWFDPSDPRHNQVVDLPASTRLAMEYALATGRGGKGCVILFAAGNGNESVDNDGYASFSGVVAVAACNDRSKRSVYSDFGKAVLCSFPSSDFADAATGRPAPLTSGITTTDWTDRATGSRGYNSGNYTDTFGGTSSACPGAAGVAALILSSNRELTWQQVRDLLGKACDRIDPQAGAYDPVTNRSKFYGFGRLNAERAVQLAKPSPSHSVELVRNVNTPLPDLRTVSVTLDVGENEPLANVAVSVELLHTYIGDLIITLTPPAAMGVGKITLQNRAGGSRKNLKQRFEPVSLAALTPLLNKRPKGVWTLTVQDKAVRDEGTLVKFGLSLTLPAAQPRLVSELDEAADMAEAAPMTYAVETAAAGIGKLKVRKARLPKKTKVHN